MIATNQSGMQTIQAPDLATLLWAIGKNDASDRWNLASTCINKMQNPKQFRRLRAADLSRAIWGLGQLNVTLDLELFIDNIRRYLRFTVDVTQREMFNQEAVEFVIGFSRLGIEHGKNEILTYILQDMTKRKKPLTEEQRQMIFQICHQMKYTIKTTQQIA